MNKNSGNLHRHRFETNFTIIGNKLINDTRLKPAAKAVWAFYQSRCDGWRWSIAGTAAALNVGKETVVTANKQLEACGYLRREQIYDEKGHFNGFDYYLIAEPGETEEAEDDESRSANQNIASLF